MIERKHVEAIREKFNRCGFCDCGECEEFTDALDAAISVAPEAADVANFAMMIWDRTRTVPNAILNDAREGEKG